MPAKVSLGPSLPTEQTLGMLPCAVGLLAHEHEPTRILSDVRCGAGRQPHNHSTLRASSLPVPDSMPMPMVSVRHVRVIVNERDVAVRVGVRLPRRIVRAVLVLVVRVMNV